MTQIDKVLYTAKTHTTGGRDGASRSADGRLASYRRLALPAREPTPSSCSPPVGPPASKAPWRTPPGI
jgi:hypothetical protein